MDFRRRSSGVVNFKNVTFSGSPGITHSRANLVDMGESSAGNDPPPTIQPKISYCLQSINSWNIHRLLLAGCIILIGLLVVAAVFHSDAKLPSYFGAFHCATIPIASIGLFVFWFKIRKLIQMMSAAMAEHHVHAANCHDSQFAGIDWIKWRVHVFIITSWMDVVGNIAFIVLQSINLHKATVLLREEHKEEHKDTSVEMAEMLLALFTLVVLCGVISLFSMIHGCFIVTLLFGYFNHVSFIKKHFYPVEIRVQAQDDKPVLLF